ncbi:hypothetical protein ACET3Z_029165 [Daucus carota]
MKLSKDINSDEAVALDAAAIADTMISDEGGGMIDVMPLDITSEDLGIETIGGIMTVLSPKNTSCPCLGIDPSVSDYALL